jgi:hypothetical protein
LHRAVGEHVKNRDFVFPSRLVGHLKRRVCHSVPDPDNFLRG